MMTSLPQPANRTTTPSINTCWGRYRTIYPISYISMSSVSEYHRICGVGGLCEHYSEFDTFLLDKTCPVYSIICDTIRCHYVTQMLLHTYAPHLVYNSVASSVVSIKCTYAGEALHFAKTLYICILP